MKKLKGLFIISSFIVTALTLSGCQMLENFMKSADKTVAETQKEIQDATTQVVETKKEIENKINDVNEATNKVMDAKQAVDKVFE